MLERRVLVLSPNGVADHLALLNRANGETWARSDADMAVWSRRREGGRRARQGRRVPENSFPGRIHSGFVANTESDGTESAWTSVPAASLRAGRSLPARRR
jgi:hypothetical protein